MPSKYEPSSIDTVSISSSVLLSLLRHTAEHHPALFSGALLGFDDEESLDITHAFPYPYPDQYEGGSFKSRSGGQYQRDLLESYKKLGYGVELQGWFQSSISGNFVTTQLIEGLAQQQLLNPNMFILVHNMSSIGQEVDLKALRLSPGFMSAYMDGRWKSKDLDKHEISYLSIFEQLEIDVQNQALVDLFLSNTSVPKTTESELKVLNLLSHSSSITHLLESLCGQVDSFNYDQNNFNYYQRQYSKESSKIQQWKQQRKYDNLERAKIGEKELDPEEWKSLFRLPVEPSRYNNLLQSHSINALADDVLKKCDEELQKSFVIKEKLTSA
ncbi:hypothetical protein KGF56_004345 [Candida oxycetoniae]|uniref:Eukaryotic translation initiation factor 3 subunit H n=1 Tax=Candida oxycetoniae TaxID=497107 RepID=A0AAI9SUF1_9ASCO|nr:uncharacterized protein KGF56_004345 [Candida oxycetoniae]KAI3402884.2 hypothetical protein KGF56_004345 [Candida oxycetoniae]